MIWFVESPWPSIVLGVVLELLLAVALVRSGRSVLIAVMVLVLVLTSGMVTLERFVVTRTEEVEASLDTVAAAIEANDLPAVYASFSPKCPRLDEVRSQLHRVKVRSATIGGDLKISFNELTLPPSATATFTGHVEAQDTRGEIPYEHMIRKFKVKLVKPDSRWLIADFSDDEPRGRASR